MLYYKIKKKDLNSFKSFFIYDIIITYLIPNSPILPYIKEYNPELAKSTNMYNQWLKQIDKRLGSVVIDHVEYSIKEVLENKMLNCVSDD